MSTICIGKSFILRIPISVVVGVVVMEVSVEVGMRTGIGMGTGVVEGTSYIFSSDSDSSTR